MSAAYISVSNNQTEVIANSVFSSFLPSFLHIFLKFYADTHEYMLFFLCFVENLG